MKLSSAIQNYVALERSLGAVFSVDAGILRSFSRALGDVCLQAITAEDCRTFCRGKGLPTRFWERKHESLRGFFRYLVSRGILVNSPFQDPAPRIQRTFRPHIYSHDELRRLLEAAAQERNPRTRLEPETLRTIITLALWSRASSGRSIAVAPLRRQLTRPGAFRLEHKVLQVAPDPYRSRPGRRARPLRSTASACSPAG